MSLATLLKPLFSRRVSLVLGIWGEAGIGKTFAVSSALRELPIRSYTVHATASNLLIAQVLPRPVWLPVWAERQLELIGRGHAVDGSDAESVFATLLAALAPVILHVEDLHEANPERLEFWTDLGEAVQRTKGLGLVVTGRTSPPEVFRPVRLEPLSHSDSDALLESEAGSSVPREALRWIYQRAAGNPLFTLEFFRFLARRGQLWSNAKRWHWREPPADLVPVTVEALIETVLSSVQDASEMRLMLEVKALLPLGSNLALMARVTGLESEILLEVQAHLEHEGILDHGEFVHPLYREITHRNLNTNRRRELSRRALEVLSNEDVCAAANFVEAAALEPEEALRLLERAADAARSADDAVHAARFLAQASGYAHGETKGRLALEAARGFRGAYPTEATHLAELAVNHLPENSEAIFELAELYVTNQRMDQANRTLERLPDDQRNGPGFWARLIFIKSWAGNSGEAITLWDAHPEWQASADPHLIYRITFVLPQSRNAQRSALIEKTLERPNLSTLERARLLSVIAYIEYEELCTAQAIEHYSEVIHLARLVGNTVGEAAMLGNRANARHDLGQYTDARADLEASMRLHAEGGSRLGVSFAQQSLAGLLIDFAEYEPAEEMLLEALEVMQRADPSEFLVDCESVLCDLYLAWQAPHGKIMALKHAHAALSLAQGLDLPRAIRKGLIRQAAALNANGDHARALRASEQAIALSESDGLRYSASAQVERARALEGLGRFEAALESFRQIESRVVEFEPQKTIHEVGLELDRLRNNLAQAKERLAWFEAHGLLHDANLVKRYFPALAFPVDSSAAHATSSDDLPRLEVLGPARILLNEEIISGRAAKRLDLLVCLLEARITGRSEVSQLELFDALYPDVTEDQAAGSLKKIVQLVRDQLGRGTIRTTAHGYAIGAVRSDAEEFLETLDTRVWRGTYLAGVRLERDDDTVRDVLHHVLRSRIETVLEIDPKEAARASRILLEAEAHDLGILELALRSLRASDNHKSLNRTYSEARTRLLEVGETLPERWQDFLESRAWKPA